MSLFSWLPVARRNDEFPTMAKNAKPKIQSDAAYEIQRATEELALPNRDDMPGITKLTDG